MWDTTVLHLLSYIIRKMVNLTHPQPLEVRFSLLYQRVSVSMSQISPLPIHPEGIPVAFPLSEFVGLVKGSSLQFQHVSVCHDQTI